MALAKRRIGRRLRAPWAPRRGKPRNCDKITRTPPVRLAKRSATAGRRAEVARTRAENSRMSWLSAGHIFLMGLTIESFPKFVEGANIEVV